MIQAIRIDQAELSACESLKIASFNDLLIKDGHDKLIVDYPYIYITYSSTGDRNKAYQLYSIYETSAKVQLNKWGRLWI